MLILEIMYFNPRSLTGATGGGIVAQLLEQFQSTLPHGSDADEHLLQAVLRISIHAPSRERQGLLQLLAIGAGISIHAPSRERHYSAGSAVCCIYFNPRSLTGATGFGKSIPLPARISIHAPLRERRIIFFCRYSAFQSTLPHGSDQLFSLNRLVLAYFTPRSLAGATLPSVSFVLADLISIHAPLRERPEPFRCYNLIYNISIHAPSRERL